MTIYKTQTGEKKTDKDPDVLTEPLVTEVKEEAECEEGGTVGRKLVLVTYFPRRHRTWVNLCLILTGLLVLGTGAIAAIFLYGHLSNKVVTGRCGVTYYDEFYHKQAKLQVMADDPIDFMVRQSLRTESEQAPMDYIRPQSPKSSSTQAPMDYIEPLSSVSRREQDFFEEEIEVSEVDLYERLTVPRFDEVEDTVIWHDFDRNISAIVNPNRRTCYIMPLNRSRIEPPRSLIDLLIKLKNQYYIPKASVVREQYRIVMPPLNDLTALGSIIMRECQLYFTFHLEKRVSGVYKRSTDEVSHAMVLEAQVGFHSLRKNEKSVIYKYDIYHMEEVMADKVPQDTPVLAQ